MELASEKYEIKCNNIIKRYKIDDVIDDVNFDDVIRENIKTHNQK